MKKLLYKLQGKRYYNYETIISYNNYKRYLELSEIKDKQAILTIDEKTYNLEYDEGHFDKEHYDQFFNIDSLHEITYLERSNMPSLAMQYVKCGSNIKIETKLSKYKTFDTVFLKNKINYAVRIPFTSVYITSDLECYTFKELLENNSFNQILRFPNSASNIKATLFRIPEELLFSTDKKYNNFLLNGKYELSKLYYIAREKINFEYLIESTNDFNKHLEDIKKLYSGLKFTCGEFILENNKFDKYYISMGMLDYPTLNINCAYFKSRKLSNTSFEIETIFRAPNGVTTHKVKAVIDFLNTNKKYSSIDELLINIALRALVPGYQPGYTYQNLFTGVIPTDFNYITWSEK